MTVHGPRSTCCIGSDQKVDGKGFRRSRVLQAETIQRTSCQSGRRGRSQMPKTEDAEQCRASNRAENNEKRMTQSSVKTRFSQFDRKMKSETSLRTRTTRDPTQEEESNERRTGTRNDSERGKRRLGGRNTREKSNNRQPIQPKASHLPPAFSSSSLPHLPPTNQTTIYQDQSPSLGGLQPPVPAYLSHHPRLRDRGPPKSSPLTGPSISHSLSGEISLNDSMDDLPSGHSTADESGGLSSNGNSRSEKRMSRARPNRISGVPSNYTYSSLSQPGSRASSPGLDEIDLSQFPLPNSSSARKDKGKGRERDSVVFSDLQASLSSLRPPSPSPSGSGSGSHSPSGASSTAPRPKSILRTSTSQYPPPNPLYDPLPSSSPSPSSHPARRPGPTPIPPLPTYSNPDPSFHYSKQAQKDVHENGAWLTSTSAPSFSRFRLKGEGVVMPVKAPVGYKSRSSGGVSGVDGVGRKSESEVYTRASGSGLKRTDTNKTAPAHPSHSGKDKEVDTSKSLRSRLSIRSVSGLSLSRHRDTNGNAKEGVPPIPTVIITPHSRSASMATVDEKRSSLLSPSFTPTLAPTPSHPHPHPHPHAHANGHAHGNGSAGGILDSSAEAEYFAVHTLEPVPESISSSGHLTRGKKGSSGSSSVDITELGERGERATPLPLPLTANGASTGTGSGTGMVKIEAVKATKAKTVTASVTDGKEVKGTLLGRTRTMSFFRSKSTKSSPAQASSSASPAVPTPAPPPSSKTKPITVKASSEGHHINTHHHHSHHHQPSSAPLPNGAVPAAISDSLPSPSSSIESSVSASSISPSIASSLAASSTSVVSPPVLSKVDPISTLSAVGGGENKDVGTGASMSVSGKKGFGFGGKIWKRVF
ncbi:hypothetical protein SISSUDRAFT_1117034 [Sistotremastrum suecicum HHB10207 ss-3]|uniref:Uncharacterized protein n=1 Tax=Sistotremastrum suecicum HHB10207 ss-3 TaxID=1314776 RepID=A0A166H2V4_9AGAM|nr:hypothetical protein SISSUDRAFT_1117034 [Sistotremastrum suecicum HHB10207 ss-3]